MVGHNGPVWRGVSFSLPVEEEGPTDGDVALNGEDHRGETGAGEGDLWEEEKHYKLA